MTNLFNGYYVLIYIDLLSKMWIYYIICKKLFIIITIISSSSCIGISISICIIIQILLHSTVAF